MPKESFENESIKSDTSKMNVSFVANIKYPVKVDEEVHLLSDEKNAFAT